MTDTDKARPISIRIDPAVRAAIDAEVGEDGDRTAWIREAIEMRLAGDTGPHAGMTALTGQAPPPRESLRERASRRRG